MKPRCMHGGCRYRGKFRERPTEPQARDARAPKDKPMFCSLACAMQYVVEQTMDESWCAFCGEWFGRAFRDEHEHEQETR